MSAAELARRAVVGRVLADAVKAEQDATRAALMAELDPGDRKSVHIAGHDAGYVLITKGRTAWRVTDPAALLAWVEESAPDEVVTVRTVRSSYVDALLLGCRAAGAPVTRHGELIPGVEAVAGDPYPTVKPSADAVTAIREAVASGEITLTDLALPQIGGAA